MGSLLLPCAPTWLFLVAGWCLMGATPRGQPWTLALMLPHGRDGLCAQLWASWEPDAVVMDPRTDTFADPAKVRAIDFEGTYYRSRGPLNATPSPQGRPVIIQAGTSERGQDFAARHAEAIIVGRETPDEMKRFYDAFKARMRKHRAGAGRVQDLLPGQADHRRHRRGGPAAGRRAVRQRAGRGRPGGALDAAADRPVHLRPRSAAPRRAPDAGDPGHPQPARQVLRARPDPDPAGDRHPQGQSRLHCRSLGRPSASPTAWRAPSRRSAAMASPSGRVSGRATSARSWSRSSRCSSSAAWRAQSTRGPRCGSTCGSSSGVRSSTAGLDGQPQQTVTDTVHGIG